MQSNTTRPQENHVYIEIFEGVFTSKEKNVKDMMHKHVYIQSTSPDKNNMTHCVYYYGRSIQWSTSTS